MTLHEDLLDLAKDLARHDPQRPRQATLRRAISTAYYALFHLLVHEASSRLVRGGDRDALRAQVRRAFDHGKMKKVSQFFYGRKNLPQPWQATVPSGVPPEVRYVASTFATLQAERHAADYDTTATYTRQGVLYLLGTVEAAFKKWVVVRGTPEADAYLTAMLALRDR